MLVHVIVTNNVDLFDPLVEVYKTESEAKRAWEHMVRDLAEDEDFYENYHSTVEDMIEERQFFGTEGDWGYLVLNVNMRE